MLGSQTKKGETTEDKESVYDEIFVFIKIIIFMCIINIKHILKEIPCPNVCVPYHSLTCKNWVLFIFIYLESSVSYIVGVKEINEITIKFKLYP